jgi:hypothetical protein
MSLERSKLIRPRGVSVHDSENLEIFRSIIKFGLFSEVVVGVFKTYVRTR